jgi:hypothetical protein
MIENASGIGLEELSEIDFDLGNEVCDSRCQYSSQSDHYSYTYLLHMM